MAASDLSGSDDPEIALEIDPATVCFLIAKARALDAKAAAGSDEVAETAEDDLEEALEKYSADPAAAEMREVIDELNEDEQVELVALSWVGRGDFLAEEWDDALTAARDRHTGPSSTYLLGMPLLGDLLEEGFTAVGYSCEDYEVPL